MQYQILKSCHVCVQKLLSVKHTKKSNGSAAMVKFFVLFFIYSDLILFLLEDLSVIYVSLSVHGFQTNDSMPAPEIRVMRIAEWLIRRKDDPAFFACSSDVSSKRFFFDEIKNRATDGHVLYYIISGLFTEILRVLTRF